MALSETRVRDTADACALLSNRMATLLADVEKFLDYNSDQAIDWAHANTKTFTVDANTDTCTANAHGFANGQKVRVSSSGDMPEPIVAGTDYWLVAVATNTFQLATTKGGSAINLTSEGSGTLTLHPTPDYFFQDEVGNLSGRTFSRQSVSNAIGSLDWFRKLMTNTDMSGSQGDHLGNVNQLAKPLG